MTHHVKFSGASLSDIIRQLRANDARVIVLPAGVSGLSGTSELLVPAARFLHSGRTSPARAVVTGAASRESLQSRVASLLARPAAEPPAALVAVGVGPASGFVAGVCLTAAGPQPLDRLSVIAPGLPRISCAASTTAPHPHLEDPTLRKEVWSRTIGALGESAWSRLQSLSYCIVGCGRSGSLLAQTLSRAGVERITLLDPDVVELHNTGEMDLVGVSDVGRFKVDSVAERLRPHGADTPTDSIAACPQPVESLSSLVAMKPCDVIFSCPDRPAARLLAALVAKLYLKPLVDVGTGIFRDGVAGRRAGADVRLVLPETCLLCSGGVAGLSEDLANFPGGSTADRAPDWRHQRAGSLRSLNSVAVGLAVRLLEDFIAGAVRNSVWLHLDYDDGIPRVEQRPLTRNPQCPLCPLEGHGDSGLAALPALLNGLRGN